MKILFLGLLAIEATSFATLGPVDAIKKDVEDLSAGRTAVAMSAQATMLEGANICAGKKPIHSDAAGTNEYYKNVDCMVGRCRLTVSKPVLKAPVVSTLESTIR